MCYHWSAKMWRVTILHDPNHGFLLEARRRLYADEAPEMASLQIEFKQTKTLAEAKALAVKFNERPTAGLIDPKE